MRGIRVPRTKRTAAFVTGVVVAAVALALVSPVLLGLLSGPDADAETTRFVPADADAVVHVEVSSLVDDPTTEALYEGMASGGYDELLAEAENATGLDPDGLDEATAFLSLKDGGPPLSEPYVGVVFRADWSAEGLRGAVGDAVETEKNRYNGVPFYELGNATTETLYFTALADGVFVVGTEGAVRDSSDVSWDGAEALGGEVLGALDTTEGEVRFALSASDGAVEAVRAAAPSERLPTEALRTVSVVSGAYHADADNDTVGVTVRLRPSGSENADGLRETVDGILSAARLVSEDETAERIDSVETGVRDDAVLLSYETTPEDVAAAARALGAPERADRIVEERGIEETIDGLVSGNVTG